MSADHQTPRFNSDTGGEDCRDALHPSADLAPDLVELALQLGDDAAFLAARYPAAQFASAQADSTQAAVASPPRDAQWCRWARRLRPVAALFVLAVSIGLLATNHVADIPLATESLKKQPVIPTNQPDRQVELAAGRGDHSSSTEIPLEDRPGNHLAGPQSKALTADGGEIEVPNAQGVEEVSFGAPPAASRMARDALSMLRTQLMAFEKVIQRLQLELERRDELQARTEAQLQELTEEVAKLRGRKSEELEAPADKP